MYGFKLKYQDIEVKAKKSGRSSRHLIHLMNRVKFDGIDRMDMQVLKEKQHKVQRRSSTIY